MAVVAMAVAVKEGDRGNGNGGGGDGCGNSDDGSGSDDVSGSSIGIGGGGSGTQRWGAAILRGCWTSSVHRQPIANSQKWGSIGWLKKMSPETMLVVNLYHIDQL